MLRQSLNVVRRVLMTTDAVGGVWRYSADLASGLRSARIECRIAGLGPPPSSGFHPDLVWTDEKLDWLVDGEVELAGEGEALADLAREFRADVLHLNAPGQAADLPRDLSAIVVVASHSCVPSWWEAVRASPLPDPWEWHRRRNRAGFDRAEIVLSPTAAHAEALTRIYGPIPGLRVVWNASGATLPPQASREPFVFCAGRWWDEAKGGAVLDRAAASLDWPVLMAGALNGLRGETFEPQFAEALGELPASNVRASMRRAAIFASPSRYEPFGLAVLEAALSGCALVLSDIPSFRELWSGAAVFVPAGDAEAWGLALARLIGDPERRTDLAAAAFDRAQAFTPKRQLAGILDSYALVTA